MSSLTPNISVVIPTYNRPKQLLACLEALCEKFPQNAEVIVVSDGGDPNLFPDLSPFESGLNLKIIHAEHGGPASARNHGLDEVRGQIVAFTDDDCLPGPGWLQTISQAVSTQPPICVGGKTVNALEDNVYAECMQMILDLVELDQVNLGYPCFFFASNNIAFPVNELKTLGGFNQDFRTAEDRELCRRWQRAGHTLEKSEQAIVAHAPEMTFKSFWKKYSQYGEGAAHFHEDPNEGWRNTLAWHLRLPGLTWQYLRTNRPKRPLALVSLLVIWEFANLAGFIKGACK